MANQSTAAHLYASVTKLAYTETQQAIHPRPPFAIANRSNLMEQAKAVADCAAKFRQKDAISVSQTDLFSAQEAVSVAQTMFDVINSSVSNTLTVLDVYQAVNNAVTEIEQL